MKSLPFCLFVVCALALGIRPAAAQTAASAPRATANSEHSTLQQETLLNQEATDDARKLARALHLNESQYIQVRAFDYVRLHAATDAVARFAGNPEELRTRDEQAAATFQAQVVNLLTDDQLTTYFELMARDARRAQAREQKQQMETTAPAAPADSASAIGSRP